MRSLLAATIALTLSLKGQAYTLDDLLSDLESANVNTVAEALSLLPDDQKTNFTFMHNSGGLQLQTSYDNPRAITFSDDGKFILTFSMHEVAEDPATQSLEIIQFNDSTNAFEMFDLQFPIPKNPDGTLVKPETNPPICLKCHSSDPKIIWGEVNRWAGAFGAIDDRLDEFERYAFEDFRDEAVTNPRYKNLKFNLGQFYPYWANGRPDVFLRPNFRLGVLALRLNSKRVRRMLEESPLYSKYRWVLYGSAVCKTDFDKEEDGWSRDDAMKLYDMLNVDIRMNNNGQLPFPGLPEASLYNITNLAPADLNLSTSDPKNTKPLSISWFDGTSAPGDFIFYDLKQRLKAEDPRISHLGREVSTTEALRLFRRYDLLSTEYSREFFKSVDDLGGKYLIGSQSIPPECSAIKENIKTSLGI